MELAGVELADGVELTTPVKKVPIGSVEKSAVGPCAEEACGEREAR